jgi:ribosomal protein S18 acetylase RimI-like enzyme
VPSGDRRGVLTIVSHVTGNSYVTPQIEAAYPTNDFLILYNEGSHLQGDVVPLGQNAKDIFIRSLRSNEHPPMNLLLLADPSQEMVEGYIQRGHCFVAESEGDVVGVYVLIDTRPKTVELVNVAVAEDKQGQGIGKALVQHAVEMARIQAYHTIEVGTGNAGIGQLALYQKCGFRITGVDRDFFLRHYADPIFENGIPCVDMVRLSQEL